MKEKKNVSIRLKKVKSLISPSYYERLKKESNRLFKSNGINCSCSKCRALTVYKKYKREKFRLIEEDLV